MTDRWITYNGELHTIGMKYNSEWHTIVDDIQLQMIYSGEWHTIPYNVVIQWWMTNNGDDNDEWHTMGNGR